MSEATTKPIRHLMWDWNGTLMDDMWLCVEVLNALLADRDLPPVDTETYRVQFGFPVVDYYQRLGFNFKKERFEEISALFIGAYNHRREECVLHPDAESVLLKMGNLGMRQTILSAYKQDTLEDIIAFYGLSTRFDAVFGLDDVHAYGKTALAIRKMEVLGLSRDDVLLIGDTVHDYEVACAIGVRCHLVSHGHHAFSRLAACGVPVHSTLTQLANALESLLDTHALTPLRASGNGACQKAVRL